MSLSGLVQQGMQGVTQTIQQMTSIERILQYTELEPVSLFKLFYQSNQSMNDL